MQAKIPQPHNYPSPAMTNQNDIQPHLKSERTPLFWFTSESKSISLRCGAHARSTGEPCKAKAMENGRCRNHGGMSTGAKTEEGKAAIRLALKERMKGEQGIRAKEGYRRWYESGGREKLSKATALRQWKRNPLWIHFGIIPIHLR